MVRLVHNGFCQHRGVSPGLIQALIRFAIDHGLPEPSEQATRAIVDIWAASGEAMVTPLNDAELFVLNRSIIEVLRSATLHSSPLLGTRALEDAVVRLVTGFLTSARPAPSSASTARRIA